MQRAVHPGGGKVEGAEGIYRGAHGWEELKAKISAFVR